MAERRMISKAVADSDAFLDMSQTAQNLYFHLLIRADDDGFINNPKKLMRMIGSGDDDLRVLLAKRFLLMFESGVIVIKHWRLHNTIRLDRYKPTVHQEEMNQIELKGNQVYTERLPIGLPSGNQMETQINISQVKLGKDKLNQDNIGAKSLPFPSDEKRFSFMDDDPIPEPPIYIQQVGRMKRFVPPTIDEVTEYILSIEGDVKEAEKFWNYFESTGWKRGRGLKLSDWKAAVRNWLSNAVKFDPKKAADEERKNKLREAGFDV